jgi:hypothetical protein
VPEIPTFEQPPRLSAAEALGAAARGQHFRIQRVTNDGLMNGFTVASAFQVIDAYGNSMALERAAEQRAIADLRALKNTDAFRDGLTSAVNAPISLTREVLTDPVAVVGKVPQGVSNLVQDAAGALKGLRLGAEDDDELDTTAMLKDIAGYTRTKRRLAAQFGVDVYSSNDVLQEDLNAVSWVVFAGGASVQLAMSQTPMAAGMAMRTANQLEQAKSDAWEVPEETFRQAGITELVAMGLGTEEAFTIVKHPVCSITHQLGLVAALADLHDVAGRDRLLRDAMGAADETECRKHAETAELLRTYHRRVHPIARVSTPGGQLVARDANGGDVWVLRGDHFIWNEANAALVDALRQRVRRTLWLSGSASERTADELAARGIQLEADALERYPIEFDIPAILLPDRTASFAPQENQTRKLIRDSRESAGSFFNAAKESILNRGSSR